MKKFTENNMKNLSFLKERAKEFWEEALRLFNEGKYNLSVFNLEQAVQLWIKYLIGAKLGEWPKVHYFSDLIKELAKTYDSNEILDFFQKHELFFSNLEDAYFTSRYFPKMFSSNLLSQLIKESEEFIKITEKITKEKFWE